MRRTVEKVTHTIQPIIVNTAIGTNISTILASVEGFDCTGKTRQRVEWLTENQRQPEFLISGKRGR
jgi:hypothetical protein